MKWEIIVGVSSVVIALCALIFTIRQSKETQKHNKLSFKPHLTTWSHTDVDKDVYIVELINNGLGPALIENFIVKIDGEIIPGKGTELMEDGLNIIFPNTQYKSHQSYLAKGHSMAAKDKCKLVQIQFTGKVPPTTEEVERGFDRVDLIVNYKSFYDENFTYSSEEEKAKNK